MLTDTYTFLGFAVEVRGEKGQKVKVSNSTGKQWAQSMDWPARMHETE